MKVARNYILVVNHFTYSATYSTKSNKAKVWNQPLSNVYDCSLNELKHNIRLLRSKGLTVIRR